MASIRLKKGLDIPLAGKPEQSIYPAQRVTSVALLGTDFVGLKPKLWVNPGDSVSLGQTLFHDKRDPQIQYTAPGSGTVVAVNRGARRVLQSIVIALDEAAVGNTAEGSADHHAGENTFPIFHAEALTALDEHTVREQLLSSGLWTALRTRPFNRVPHSRSHPQAIFITAMDTRPLSANPQVIIDAQHEAFGHGLQIIAKLTTGPVYLCTACNKKIATPVIDRLQQVTFSGPHPAGLVGTHINHLHPVSIEKPVWHIGYQDVIAIGKLFTHGKIYTERVVALGGPAVNHPRLLKTRLGANIDELLHAEIAPGISCRHISGSVLDGRTVSNTQAYLGRYHQQISVLADNPKRRRLFGWLRALGSDARFTTAQHGRPTAMLPVNDFERVMPLDILPSPLLRALLVRDSDLAQQLGCLDLAEEDLALCAYVCPAKYDYGSALRINLEQIERQG